jgi:hypothetical protein
MTIQPDRTTAGVTLRHWTINSLSFVGGRQLLPAQARWDVADGRSVNLVAARLKAIKAALARRG